MPERTTEVRTAKPQDGGDVVLIARVAAQLASSATEPTDIGVIVGDAISIVRVARERVAAGDLD